jgi:hypothetical protein
MESKFLLPNKCKTIGWILLIPSFILGVMWLFNFRYTVQAPVFAVWSSVGTAETAKFLTVIYKNIYNEIVAVPLMLSLLLVTFAREKNEDEYISKIRLDSLVWAIYINFIILFISLFFVFQDAFINIMIFNMFTLLILFVARFNIILFKEKHRMTNEK